MLKKTTAEFRNFSVHNTPNATIYCNKYVTYVWRLQWDARCHAIYLSLAFRQGRMQDFSGGGGPTLKFLGFCIYMPQSGMSRAAKLRAFASGVWGHAPPRKFLKMVQFRAF